MKFLVLALCVCAASAASFGQTYQPYQQQAFAQAVSSPGAAAAPTAYAAAKVVAAAPIVAAKTVYAAGKDAAASIVRSESEVNPNGFNYFYQTDNGIAAQASGVAKQVGKEEVVVIQGSYKYIDNDGKEVVVNYVADENGYQPQSDILPVGPAIPEAIVRSLEFIRTHYKPSEY